MRYREKTKKSSDDLIGIESETLLMKGDQKKAPNFRCKFSPSRIFKAMTVALLSIALLAWVQKFDGKVSNIQNHKCKLKKK